ncbi:DUF3301 domain-containing protein [Thiotrichales bacterium 19S9-12]|nr:DUF3301 domain-containing protein [Thiotrichales bacterium 19S9-11]MCF6811421.1 DUF3301 domain-containing protein [Thiotrichales bacterium 19S9-12]
MWYVSVLLILFIVSIVLIWLKKARYREYLVLAAKAFCKKENLQFLDGSVTLMPYQKKTRLVNEDAKINYYQFACSDDGLKRLTGTIKVRNQLIVDVFLENISYHQPLATIDSLRDNVIQFHPRLKSNKDE